MENKINIAEILKDCPRGMELDCLMYDNVTLDSVSIKNDHPIKIAINNNVYITLTKYGQNLGIEEAKCVIFPKDKTTWEGFQIPFKDGDVAISDRGDIHLLRTADSSYCAYRKNFRNPFDKTITTSVVIVRLATEEEKQKLFDVIKAHGYKWNAETKTLEKLVEPKFKVGDRITDDKKFIYRITEITDKGYKLHDLKTTFITLEEADRYFVKVVDIFDIDTLIPFESRVLVRNDMDGLWKPAVFGFRNGYNDNAFYIVGGSCWKQCIPYLNNEHLCGTTNDCNEYYKTWE